MKKLILLFIPLFFLASCKQGQNECSCEDMIDRTQEYSSNLAGLWLNNQHELSGSYYFNFDANGTGYYTMTLGAQYEQYNWEIKKISGKYYIHRSNLRNTYGTNNISIEDDYIELQFVENDIIVMTGLNTRSGTYYRQK